MNLEFELLRVLNRSVCVYSGIGKEIGSASGAESSANDATATRWR